MSSSAFSNRYALNVLWAKDQDSGPNLEYEAVETIMGPRRFVFTMKTIATPDSTQSLGFIAVFALFQICSAGIGEEKAYIRLPTTWRNLWAEFRDLHKSQVEGAEKSVVRNLKSLVERHFQDNKDEDIVLVENLKKRSQERKNPQNEKPLQHEQAMEQPKDYARIWQEKSSTSLFQEYVCKRQNLPMWQFKDHTIRAVDENRVTIICGETGCGKSTQVPSFLIESELKNNRPCKIYCTQPRRISAITLAQRVSQEIGEQKSDIGTTRSLIGYAVRLESRVASSARLVYATTGIVLRMLEDPEGMTDITHIIVDEVHERSIETDFLLIVLRTLLVKRPNLRIVLMSATVEANRFSNYFDGAPILNVPGRTFAVQQKYLEDAIEITGHKFEENEQIEVSEDEQAGDEKSLQPSVGKQFLASYMPETRNAIAKWNKYRIDYKLIERLITLITFTTEWSQYNRAILVFLPGIAEIRRVNDFLSDSRLAKVHEIHMLHSTISSEAQQAAFNTDRPPGRGKIVLATNIAETGITIPDITCVIDTGTHREMRFDERRQISRLVESFISHANAKQRCGRAGRVQEGICFHLFPRFHYETRMPKNQTPEMLRLSLQDLVMRVKVCKLGDIQTTLASALDPPSDKNIHRAIDTLINVSALTAREDLTDLGFQLAELPLDPYLGKLVLFGAQFSCLDVALTLAAILTTKSPFVVSAKDRKEADLCRAAFAKHSSDLLTDYAAYAAWRRTCTSNPSSEAHFYRKNGLSLQVLTNIEDIKAQLLTILVDRVHSVKLSPNDRSMLSSVSINARPRRFVPHPASYNMYSENRILVAAVIAWAFDPKLLSRDPANAKVWRNVASSQPVSLHPTSIVRMAPSPNAQGISFLSFYSILQAKGGRYNANALTPVAPLGLALLSGTATFHFVGHVVSLDGARLRFVVDVPALKRKSGEGDAEAVVGPWKTFIALKFLRRRLEEIVRCKSKSPGKGVGDCLERWEAAWVELVREWELVST